MPRAKLDNPHGVAQRCPAPRSYSHSDVLIVRWSPRPWHRLFPSELIHTTTISLTQHVSLANITSTNLSYIVKLWAIGLGPVMFSK
jgi:hypothetical protein